MWLYHTGQAESVYGGAARHLKETKHTHSSSGMGLCLSLFYSVVSQYVITSYRQIKEALEQESVIQADPNTLHKEDPTH